MALSLCQRHRARIKTAKTLDKREALASSPVSFHLQMLELAKDVEQLRSLQRTEDRIEFKRDVLLPRWMPTVETYLAGDARFANPALVYCVIWLFDTGEMSQALDWADVAITENQATTTQAEAGHSIEPYFSRTFENIREKWRLHEDINAKWFKFAGLYLLRDERGRPRATAVDDVETLEQADALLAQAHAFNNNSGVRTARDKIRARINSLTKQ